MRKRKKTKEDIIILDDKIAEEKTSEEQETEVEKALFEIEDKTSVDEVKLEEQEPVMEEPVKEPEVEETAEAETVKVESGEEKPAEEESKEEGPKWWDKINKKVALITAGSILGVLLIIYLGFAVYFTKHFMFHTTVNGVGCTGKTVKDVEKMMQAQVEEYVLVLEGRHGISEEIKGVDIEIKYKSVDEIKQSLDKQKPFLWFKSLFQKKNITAKIKFEYNKSKLDEEIAKLECMKAEKQIQPISARPIYVNGAYEIEEEILGTLINEEQLYKVVHQSVAAMEKTVDLDAMNCYVAPIYTKESPEVLDANKSLNACLKATITYSLDGIVVTVDANQIANWISVDENLTVHVDENQVRAFTDTLGNHYNTPNSALDLVSPTGKTVNIPNARLGRIVGSAEECAQLIEEILGGVVVTREPIFSQGGTPGGEPIWGTTYLEVDISAQHMWYIVDGVVALESDVVTGSPSRDTPAGVFSIVEKMRNKTLVGNIVPSTGQPEYRTPVSYWMRVTWSGIGFHDATWQPAFGGQLYRQGRGSHGCINMPMNNVAALYEIVNVGCPVVIHY